MSNPVSYALLQTVNPATVTANSQVASLTATKFNSLILAFIGTNAIAETVSSVTDNAGNTYLNAYAHAASRRCELWYAIATSPTTSVTANYSGSSNTKSLFVREYGGISTVKNTAFDQQVSTSGSGTAVSTGASSATRDANELVVCSCTTSALAPTMTVGAGFGNLVTQTFASTSIHGTEDLTASTIGAQTGLMTVASGSWDAGLATFIIVAGHFAPYPGIRPHSFSPGIAR